MVTDKDSSMNSIYCKHFPEGTITYCSNHNSKTMHKDLQKVKSIKCQVRVIITIQDKYYYSDGLKITGDNTIFGSVCNYSCKVCEMCKLLSDYINRIYIIYMPLVLLHMHYNNPNAQYTYISIIIVQGSWSATLSKDDRHLHHQLQSSSEQPYSLQ